MYTTPNKILSVQWSWKHGVANIFRLLFVFSNFLVQKHEFALSWPLVRILSEWRKHPIPKSVTLLCVLQWFDCYVIIGFILYWLLAYEFSSFRLFLWLFLFSCSIERQCPNSTRGESRKNLSLSIYLSKRIIAWRISTTLNWSRHSFI